MSPPKEMRKGPLWVRNRRTKPSRKLSVVEGQADYQAIPVPITVVTSIADLMATHRDRLLAVLTRLRSFSRFYDQETAAAVPWCAITDFKTSLSPSSLSTFSARLARGIFLLAQ